MERAGILIERLLEQYRDNAGVDKLMITAQLLVSELQKENRSSPQTAGQKISVFFPSLSHFNEPETEPVIEQERQREPPKRETVREPDEAKVSKGGQGALFYDPIVDIPTLALKQQEVNETIARSESLHDKLKSSASQPEIGHTIKSSPVKDLRKAIGINDRYLFINELFRGDETMYDRSIKTINGFNIYGEAEFWIKRELKLKLAWKEDSEVVQVFDQLIKRRFS